MALDDTIDRLRAIVAEQTDKLAEAHSDQQALADDVKRLEAIVGKAQLWMVASGLSKHPLTIEMAKAAEAAKEK